jgi:acyl-homoserine-lactone acylase
MLLFLKTVRAPFTLLLALACSLAAAPKVEILWDQYGVPHIFAADRESMFYGNGWAQAQNQANLLLHLYGESRGKGAEYWGAEGLELARWVQLNGVPERAKEWYAAQDPTFRKYLDAFARGINDYAKAHPEAIGADVRQVLPVDGVDVVGHSLRAVHYMYMGSAARMNREVNAALRNSNVAHVQTSEEQELAPGSNTWAIGPAHSADGKAMLIINPHLAWGDTFYRYMEIHLVGPGYDLYGAPQIGFPTPVVGFNRSAGWGRTVNTIDTVDFYKLTVKDGQYQYDGKWMPFERETKTIKIKQPDGTFQSEQLEVKKSIQGPVVYDQRGMTVAMRVAGIDRPKMLEQWFRMGEAKNLKEFRSALELLSVPMWNQNYADVDGHIMIICDGTIPKRKTGDYQYWSKVVPGDTSETMWNGYLSVDELPKSIDPPSGWNANTNEPPWSMTLPLLDPAKYAPYVAPSGDAMPQLRTLRSWRMIREDAKISYEKMLADKVSTRMDLADRVLPDLLQAADANSDAAKLLAQWDHMTEVDSRGAVLFQMFADNYFRGVNGVASKVRVKYDKSRPLETGIGLADPAGAVKVLEETAAQVKKTYGALDVKWGDVYRFGSGTGDTPGNGGAGNSGIFRTIAYTRKVGNKYYAAHGETFVCAVEFSTPQKAQCSVSYGNSSQPGSPHLADQLPLMTAKKLHPVWRDRAEIEAHLEKREKF